MYNVNDCSIKDLFVELFGISAANDMYYTMINQLNHVKNRENAKKNLEYFFATYNNCDYYIYIDNIIVGVDDYELAKRLEELECKKAELNKDIQESFYKHRNILLKNNKDISLCNSIIFSDWVKLEYIQLIDTRIEGFTDIKYSILENSKYIGGIKYQKVLFSGLIKICYK